MTRKMTVLLGGGILALLTVAPGALAGGGEAAVEAAPPYWTVVPFILMLLCIALVPLFAPHWWEHNRNKAILSAVLGIFMLVYLLAFAPEGAHDKILVTLFDYVAFISLLASLFIISGGIYLGGTLAGTPAVNTLILLIGAVVANMMGTTGAAMLLIRPMIRANAWRKSRFLQMIFLTFIVANIGGLLTPLGDPPLFLGFLKRVPFEWTFRLAPQWAFTVVVVLAVFFILDTIQYRRELRAGSKPPTGEKEPLKLIGWHNFLFLALIIGVILFAGYVSQNKLVEAWTRIGDHRVTEIIEKVGQSVLMLIVAALAYKATKAETRKSNNFGWAPIAEVAILFIGIFITMIPALWILDYLGATGKLGLDKPWQFFWCSGGLSSFLDNAPTYLTFSAAASGLNHTDPNNLMDLIRATKEQTGLAYDGVEFLKAVSTGAVFMGANTYIGNGPNFMVKTIAEQDGVQMPSFFGYMVYSICILLPLFTLLTLLFLR